MQSASFATAVSQRLSACGNPGAAPEELAELFRWTFTDSHDATVLRYGLQSELLRWTLDQARYHTRFYARPEYCHSPRHGHAESPDLSMFPIVRRADIADNLGDLHADNVTFGSISHTSGCTGEALSVHRSAEELAFLWKYQARLLRPVRAKLPSRPLVLSLPNFYHGAAVPVPSLGKVFVAGATDDLLLGDLVKLFRQRFRIPGHDERISMISCLAHQMLFLTHYLLEQGIDPREFQIRSINLVGGYVPKSRRDYLHDVWGALIIDRFSLTESVGGATRCLTCGYFHLDPHVIGEVIDVDRGTAIEDGVGRLVLTQLYPFVQMQPFIRYDTGDLVRRTTSDCHAALTFEFAGKAANCFGVRHDGTTEWLILSVPLHEALDGIPDLARVEQFRGVTTRDASVGSLPRYRLVTDDPRPGVTKIAITFELRYSPHFYPNRTVELARNIRTALAETHPALVARLADHSAELDISFVGPGGLAGAGILKI